MNQRHKSKANRDQALDERLNVLDDHVNIILVRQVNRNNHVMDIPTDSRELTGVRRLQQLTRISHRQSQPESGTTHRINVGGEIGIPFVLCQIVQPDDNIATFNLIPPVVALSFCVTLAVRQVWMQKKV